MNSDPGFSHRSAAWLAALAGFALTLFAFWPGYLSWDSAYQWWQARGGALDPGHPLIMVRTWKLVRSVLPDPGGMFALPAALWWTSLALFANALGGGAVRRAATVLLIGAWPPLLALLPHLWKDVWMATFLLLAVAALAVEAGRPPTSPASSRRWLAAAALALGLGCAFRMNALPAMLPLVVWVSWRRWPGRTGPAVASAAALLATIVLGASLVNRAPGKADPVWPVLAMWDIAAVSIAEDRVLFPPDWIDPALTVADLRRDFDPAVNVPSFVAGQLHLNFYYDYTPEQFAELRTVWLALPLQHPRGYFAHRARVAAYLFGLRQAQHPDGLVLSPTVVAFADNPPLATNAGPLHRWLQPTLSALVDTPLFASWIYLVAALALVARWAWRRDGGFAGLSGAVALSALGLAAPLVLLAPSTDFRYLMWSVLATVLAVALLCARPSAAD